MAPNPCKRDCPLRRWDCHAWCEQYKRYEHANAEQRAERHNQKETMTYTIEQINKARAKSAKSRKMWGNREG